MYNAADRRTMRTCLLVRARSRLAECGEELIGFSWVHVPINTKYSVISDTNLSRQLIALLLTTKNRNTRENTSRNCLQSSEQFDELSIVASMRIVTTKCQASTHSIRCSLTLNSTKALGLTILSSLLASIAV